MAILGKYHPFLWALLVLFGGCTQKQRPPEQALSKEKLTRVLVDLELAEARLMTLRDVKPAMRDSILKDHQVQKAVFEAWMTYYAQHPEIFLPIREAVSRRLEQEAPNVPVVSPSRETQLIGR